MPLVLPVLRHYLWLRNFQCPLPFIVTKPCDVISDLWVVSKWLIWIFWGHMTKYLAGGMFRFGVILMSQRSHLPKNCLAFVGLLLSAVPPYYMKLQAGYFLQVVYRIVMGFNARLLWWLGVCWRPCGWCECERVCDNYEHPSPMPGSLVLPLLLPLCLMSFGDSLSLLSYAWEVLRNCASLLIPLSEPRRTSMFLVLPVPRICWYQKWILHSYRIWVCICRVSEQWQLWFSLGMKQQ